jgi:hypothetical protein
MCQLLVTIIGPFLIQIINYVAGQVPSLTSSNNFINFCLTVPNLPITNGKQIATGSCNPAPMGVIPSSDKMPSANFIFPPNGDTSIVEGTPFTIKMAIQNFQSGAFVNADEKLLHRPTTGQRTRTDHLSLSCRCGGPLSAWPNHTRQPNEIYFLPGPEFCCSQRNFDCKGRCWPSCWLLQTLVN